MAGVGCAIRERTGEETEIHAEHGHDKELGFNRD